jgi:hypothetical protein
VEIAWQGYVTSIRVQRSQAEVTPGAKAKQLWRPPLPAQCREVEKRNLHRSHSHHTIQLGRQSAVDV